MDPGRFETALHTGACMKLLIVDDDEITRKLLNEVFEAEGYQVTLAHSAEDAIRILEQELFPIILSDIRMLQLSGMAILAFLKTRKSNSVVILMTGFGNMEDAIQAIHEGAFDYISKPFKIQQLRSLVAKASKHWVQLELRPVAQENDHLVVSPTLIGRSEQMLDVFKSMARASMSSSNVWIMGEKGTGKELIARSIHERSARKEFAFHSLNGRNLNWSILESSSLQGTVFVDEIEELDAYQQLMLLKQMEKQDSRGVELQWIVASQKDLDSELKTGKFREDLYYRLKVILIAVAPLRERKEDLPDLIGYWIRKYADKNHKPLLTCSPDAMQALKNYSWPGNIRELEHALEHAVVMSRTTILEIDDLPREIIQSGSIMPVKESASAPSQSLEVVEKYHILKVLQETGFNKSRAADILGIDRATLYRKTQKYGIRLDGKTIE